jgi:hypothetical protein
VRCRLLEGEVAGDQVGGINGADQADAGQLSATRMISEMMSTKPRSFRGAASCAEKAIGSA